MNLELFATDNIWDDYSRWTDNVAVYPKVHEPHYLALGLCEELGEMYLAKGSEDIIAEGGDIIWYAARYARLVLNVPFSTIVSPAIRSANWLTPMEAVSVVCGVEKKRLRDGETWSSQKLSEKHADAQDALSALIEEVLAYARMHTNATPEEIIRANVAKLSQRKIDSTIQGDGDKR